MKKYIKLLPFLILPIVLVVVILFFTKKGLEDTKEYLTGNYTGNLMNGGLFSEVDNKIYFSNAKDKGCLYVMDQECKKYKKITNHPVSYINVAGKSIYYTNQRYISKNKNDMSTNENVTTTHASRIDSNGSNDKSLFSEASGVLNLSGKYMYYEHYDVENGITLYRVTSDNKENMKLADEPILPASIKEQKLYYTSYFDDHNIMLLNLNTMLTSTLLKGNYSNCVVVNDFIYYIMEDNNNSIGRCHLDGSNPAILVNEHCSSFNISPSGKYLYYQIDNDINNRFVMMNIVTKKTKDIIVGDYNYINVTSNYVFFNDSHNNTNYILTIGEKATLGTFNPPVSNE